MIKTRAADQDKVLSIPKGQNDKEMSDRSQANLESRNSSKLKGFRVILSYLVIIKKIINLSVFYWGRSSTYRHIGISIIPLRLW